MSTEDKRKETGSCVLTDEDEGRQNITMKKSQSWGVLTVIFVSFTSLICLLAGETKPGGCGARQEGSSKLSSVSKLASIIIISLSPPPASLFWESLALSSLRLSLHAPRLPSVSQATDRVSGEESLAGGRGEGVVVVVVRGRRGWRMAAVAA